jgi:hypothetical protein
MKAYKHDQLAILLNDLRKGGKYKELEPIFETIRSMLIDFYFHRKDKFTFLEDITDEAFLEELTERLRSRDIGLHKESLTLFIGDDINESIIRLKLDDNFDLEKGYPKKN